MFMITRRCNVLPNVITIVRRVTSPVDLQDDILKWCRSPLDNSTCRLCSAQAEDKYIPYSTGKTLAQIKKEQNWCYDPTIKYESLRQCAVPRFAYCDDSATDWSDSSASSDSEIMTETLAVEDAQTRKDKILAEAKKEQSFTHHPRVNYELLKQFDYVDSPDSFASPPSDSETETPADVEARNEKYYDAIKQGRILSPNPNNYIRVNAYGLPASSASETETEIEEEAQNHEDIYPAGTKDEQLFCYNPGIKYEPLKRYIVPRFAFFDSSSTDSSASSESECETETMADEEAQSQEDKTTAGSKEEQLFGNDMVKSPSTDLQSVAEDLAKSLSTKFLPEQTIPDPSFLVNHGAKSPAEGGDKVSN